MLYSPLVPRREQQSEITEGLAYQVFDALSILLAGFEAAVARDGGSRPPAQGVYAELLTTLLRLVFMLCAEARGMLPSSTLLGLFEELHGDRGADVDAMDRRSRAWPRLVAIWREIDADVREDDPFSTLPKIDDGTVYAILDALSYLRDHPVEVEQLGGVYEALMGYEVIAEAGRLLIQPGDERRRTRSHYTPRELTEPVVRRTLAPILRTLEAEADGPPSSEALLGLAIVDPAMGSGAFLVEVVRQLGDQVVAAWRREGRDEDQLETAARRLVARRCVYGVDKNARAVSLAKWSLWLVTGSRDLPLSFVDHALRQGDSLVGLSLAQLRAFDWREGQRDEPAVVELAARSLDGARLAADLCLGAFFAAGRDKARRAERARRLGALTRWIAARGEPQAAALRDELEQMRASFLDEQAPFHWMLEFSEVFQKGGFDAVVGNPPFAGKNAVSTVGGEQYLDWLKTIHVGTHGNADLCAHFVRRASVLLGPDGALGLVATNTIGQGDTRATGLARMLGPGGGHIHDATVDLPWPAPDAAVTVSIVHLARGRVIRHAGPTTLRRIDASSGRHVGRVVAQINSRLAPRPERADPVNLRSNAGLSFQGSIVLGRGFTLSPDRRAALVAADPRNGERLRPYLGGAELNRSPDQSFERYVIDFGDMSLEQARRWPQLIEIVEREVRPQRRALRDNADGRRRRQYWWQWGRRTPALDASLAELDRCLACSQVTKHLVWSRQPTDRVFAHTAIVVALPGRSALAILQARPHARWAQTLGSSMKTDLRYTPSDCFRNFPFPCPDPRTEHPALDALGEALDGLRGAFMRAHAIGLTSTYNLLLGLEPEGHAAASDPRLGELRELHRELDRAVLDTYAARLHESEDPDERALAPLFRAIEVPAYVDPRLARLDATQRAALETFNDAVLDALMALNEVRAGQERRASEGSTVSP